MQFTKSCTFSQCLPTLISQCILMHFHIHVQIYKRSFHWFFFYQLLTNQNDYFLFRMSTENTIFFLVGTSYAYFSFFMLHWILCYAWIVKKGGKSLNPLLRLNYKESWKLTGSTDTSEWSRKEGNHWILCYVWIVKKREKITKSFATPEL